MSPFSLDLSISEQHLLNAAANFRNHLRFWNTWILSQDSITHTVPDDCLAELQRHLINCKHSSGLSPELRIENQSDLRRHMPASMMFMAHIQQRISQNDAGAVIIDIPRANDLKEHSKSDCMQLLNRLFAVLTQADDDAVGYEQGVAKTNTVTIDHTNSFPESSEPGEKTAINSDSTKTDKATHRYATRELSQQEFSDPDGLAVEPANESPIISPGCDTTADAAATNGSPLNTPLLRRSGRRRLRRASASDSGPIFTTTGNWMRRPPAYVFEVSDGSTESTQTRLLTSQLYAYTRLNGEQSIVDTLCGDLPWYGYGMNQSGLTPCENNPVFELYEKRFMGRYCRQRILDGFQWRNCVPGKLTLSALDKFEKTLASQAAIPVKLNPGQLFIRNNWTTAIS